MRAWPSPRPFCLMIVAVLFLIGDPSYALAEQTPQELIDSPTCTNAVCHGGKVGKISGVDAAKARVLSTTNPMPPGGASDEIKAVFESPSGGEAPDAGSPGADPDAGGTPGDNNTSDADNNSNETSGDDSIGAGAGTQPPGLGDDTPLVLDLNGDGRIAPRKRIVQFDFLDSHDSWVSEWPSRYDGFLTLDINENGVIDSGRELFGNRSGNLDIEVDDGFQALEQYDDNNDRLIDQRDDIFPKLLVWRDHNGNGRSEPYELKGLKELGISEISLTTAPDLHPRILKRATYKQGPHVFVIADVLLQVERGLEEIGK